MTRAVTALIDLAALRHNLTRVRTAAPGSRVLVVVKANAYGHGLARAVPALAQADGFGCARVEEALVLREMGFAHRVVLLSGVQSVEDVRLAASQHFDIVVHHPHQLELLQASRYRGCINVWLKVDSGMHRLGFAGAAVRNVHERLRACDGVDTQVRLMTHFACADDADNPTTREQITEFNAVTEALEGERSLANSGGVLGWADSHADWVRPGIMLYGISPFADRVGDDHELRPVMTLSSTLIAVNHLAAGARIGYGGNYQCREPMTVGVVAAGYGDGYPRHAESGTPVLVNNQRVPLVGAVSMDTLTVDLRNLPDARPGDPVVLWGRGLPVEQVAQSAGTIAYELVCKITDRVSYEVVDES